MRDFFYTSLSHIYGFLLGKPHYLTYFVNYRCNFTCPHCLLGDLPNDYEEKGILQIEEVKRFTEEIEPIKHLAVTGGEPFLRRDILDVLKTLAYSGKFENMTIITNGWYVDKVNEACKELLASPLKKIIFKFSVDGEKEVHNQIRGMGSYEHIENCIYAIKKHQRNSEKLQWGIITTFQKNNVSKIEKRFFDQINDLNPDLRNLNLVRGTPFPEDEKESFLTSFKKHFLTFNKFNPSFRKFYKTLVLDYMLKKIGSPCQAGNTFMVLREDGSLYPCEPLERKIGNIRENQYSIKRTIDNPNYEEIRSYANLKCPQCTYEGVIPFNIVLDPKHWGRILKKFTQAIIEAPDAPSKTGYLPLILREHFYKKQEPIHSSFYKLKALDINQNIVDFEEFKGKVILIVNTASQCGYTEQYRALNDLYLKYKDKGLVILAFPSNQFKAQEPGSESMIKDFCESQFGIRFPIFSKVDVNGPYTHSVYRFLKENGASLLGSKMIPWNFTKFLISRDGHVIKKYGPSILPELIESEIHKEL